MPYLMIFVLCFFIYLGCVLFEYGSRHVNSGAVVGMAIIAAIPLINVFVAGLLVVNSVCLLYSDIMNAFKKDDTSC